MGIVADYIEQLRGELRQRDEEIAALKRVDEMGIAARNNLRALLGRALAALRRANEENRLALQRPMPRYGGAWCGTTLQNEIDAILADADGKAALDERRESEAVYASHNQR